MSVGVNERQAMAGGAGGDTSIGQRNAGGAPGTDFNGQIGDRLINGMNVDHEFTAQGPYPPPFRRQSATKSPPGSPKKRAANADVSSR